MLPACLTPLGAFDMFICSNIETMSFSLKSTVRSHPKLPYEKIKDDILGKSYSLSLVFVGDAKSKSLNYAYRKKSYIPNVLSFPLDKNTGEIFINPKEAGRQAKEFNMTVSGFIGYLFIHGLLHLEGHHHGATMDGVEARYTKRYGLK